MIILSVILLLMIGFMGGAVSTLYWLLSKDDKAPENVFDDIPYEP